MLMHQTDTIIWIPITEKPPPSGLVLASTKIDVHILQYPGYVLFEHEGGHVFRIIPLDDRPHLGSSLKLWMGDSRGHWEGNTLVVDVTHFNDQTWFDRVGNYHSDALHVIERYTRTDADHILYEATIEDPKVFVRPWKMSMTLYRHKEKDAELLEYECYAY